MTITDLRKRLGLPPLKPGIVKCLGIDCEKDFYSWDKANNRICPECKRRQNIEEIIIEKDLYISDITDEQYNLELDNSYWNFCNDNQELIKELEQQYL